jgi:hypothetical protein
MDCKSELKSEMNRLIDLVDEAFDGVLLDNGIGLREADGLDDYAQPDRLKKLRAQDEKLDWRKITPELLGYCNAAPSFLDAKGLRFHTPAFIIAELRGQAEVNFVDRFIYNHFVSAPEFIKLLTPKQREAIIACIDFYSSEYSYDYNSTEIEKAVARLRI